MVDAPSRAWGTHIELRRRVNHNSYRGNDPVDIRPRRPGKYEETDGRRGCEEEPGHQPGLWDTNAMLQGIRLEDEPLYDGEYDGPE